MIAIAAQREAWLSLFHWIAGPVFMVGLIIIVLWMIGEPDKPRQRRWHESRRNR